MWILKSNLTQWSSSRGVCVCVCVLSRAWVWTLPLLEASLVCANRRGTVEALRACPSPATQPVTACLKSGGAEQSSRPLPHTTHHTYLPHTTHHTYLPYTTHHTYLPHTTHCTYLVHIHSSLHCFTPEFAPTFYLALHSHLKSAGGEQASYKHPVQHTSHLSIYTVFEMVWYGFNCSENVNIWEWSFHKAGKYSAWTEGQHCSKVSAGLLKTRRINQIIYTWYGAEAKRQEICSCKLNKSITWSLSRLYQDSGIDRFSLFLPE